MLGRWYPFSSSKRIMKWKTEKTLYSKTKLAKKNLAGREVREVEKLKKLLNLWKRRTRASKMVEKRAQLWMRGTQGERLLAQIEIEL